MERFGIMICVTIYVFSPTEARRRGIFDSNSNSNNFRNLLDDIQQHREAEDDVFSCDMEFERENGVILRTKESISNGAEFIAADHDVTNAGDCRDACCNAYKDDVRCDLAVYGEVAVSDDDDKTRPTCFLFSCIQENGDDSCTTSQSSGFTVFRMKDEDKTEHQLDSISNSPAISPKVSGAKKSGLTSDSGHEGRCGAEFSVSSGFIIKAEESIGNGAKFLKLGAYTPSRWSCYKQCCNADFDGGRVCDFVVYKEIPDATVGKSENRCYLFSCTDENGDFQCVTTRNSNYSVSKRHTPPRVIKPSIPSQTSAAKTTPLSTSIPDITAASMITVKDTAIPTVSPTPANRKPDLVRMCGRLMWQCDNGDCVKVTEVCNDVSNCADDSDEMGCDEINNDNTKHEVPTSAKSTTTMSLLTSTTRKTASSTAKANTSSIHLELTQNLPHLDLEMVGKTEPQKGAVLPLALGLSVTACVLLMVLCRLRIVKKKSRKRGKPLVMEESDYLINGMYL